MYTHASRSISWNLNNVRDSRGYLYSCGDSRYGLGIHLYNLPIPTYLPTYLPATYRNGTYILSRCCARRRFAPRSISGLAIIVGFMVHAVSDKRIAADAAAQCSSLKLFWTRVFILYYVQ
jgi:hypothetical protein